MTRTTFPSQDNSVTHTNQVIGAPSINTMFAYSIVGIAAFFGLACAIGEMSPHPATSNSTQTVSALSRS
jgi:hypothetical protein